MLPEEVKKPLDDIKSPSNKILVTVLLLAVITLFGIFVAEIKAINAVKDQQIMELKKDLKECNERNALLAKKDQERTDADNERLKNKVEQKDSIINALKNAVKK